MIPSKNIKKKLQLGKLKINTLLEVTNGINNNLSKNKLFTIYKNVLVNELSIGKLLLYTLNEGRWKQELCIGVDSKSINGKKDLLKFKEIEILSSSPDKRLAAFDVVVPVYHKSRPLAYLLLGDFDGEKIEVSPIIKHLTFIQTLTNVIVVAIENKRLFKENMRQIAIKKEMEVASEMQAMLFPRELPNNEEIEVAAKYIPHHLIGGDYYDFIELNEDEIAFCIADISGKGVPAALLMSNFQASLRALIKRDSELTELIEDLNANVLENANREKFITIFFGVFNRSTRILKFINAGHNPPLLLVNENFHQLTDGCTILGMFNHMPSITERSIIVPENAILVCYTDGISEQVNEEDVEYGIDQIEKVVLKNRRRKINTIIDKLVVDLDSFKGKRRYKDDIALLGLKFK